MGSIPEVGPTSLEPNIECSRHTRYRLPSCLTSNAKHFQIDGYSQTIYVKAARCVIVASCKQLPPRGATKSLRLLSALHWAHGPKECHCAAASHA